MHRCQGEHSQVCCTKWLQCGQAVLACHKVTASLSSLSIGWGKKFLHHSTLFKKFSQKKKSSININPNSPTFVFCLVISPLWACSFQLPVWRTSIFHWDLSSCFLTLLIFIDNQGLPFKKRFLIQSMTLWPNGNKWTYQLLDLPGHFYLLSIWKRHFSLSHSVEWRNKFKGMVQGENQTDVTYQHHWYDRDNWKFLIITLQKH